MAQKKLATFRIDADEWEAFQEWAKRSGTNASALLVDYIEQCLDRPPSKLSKIFLNGATHDIDQRIDHLEKRLKTLEGALEQRIEKVIKQHMADSQPQLITPDNNL